MDKNCLGKIEKLSCNYLAKIEKLSCKIGDFYPKIGNFEGEMKDPFLALRRACLWPCGLTTCNQTTSSQATSSHLHAYLASI